jgi:hypothetical protein
MSTFYRVVREERRCPGNRRADVPTTPLAELFLDYPSNPVLKNDAKCHPSM